MPNVCNYNPETVVLAHYRMAGQCGVGMKPADAPFGAYACSTCHDSVDARTWPEGYSRAELRHAHAEGCLRTMAIMIEDGLIEVK